MKFAGTAIDPSTEEGRPKVAENGPVVTGICAGPVI